jgi:TonB family protein
MLCVASAVASQPKTDAPVTAAGHRISTGLVAPEIINQAGIAIPAEALGQYTLSGSKVVLSLVVDEKGNAQSVRVVKSVNPSVDAHVVNGVLKSHFRPAMLDNKPVPVEMSLTIVVQR